MPQTQMIANNLALNPNVNNTGGINWVPALNGANAWKQYANTNDILMDSVNDGIFYIKSCDNIGHSTLRVFKYEEISPDNIPVKDPNAVQMTPQTNAVTKEEFDAFKTEILEAIKNNNKNHYNNKKGQNYNNERS